MSAEINDLRRDFQRLRATAPGAIEDALYYAVKSEVWPAAFLRVPVRKGPLGGKLRASLRLRRMPDGVAFTSSLPYANTIHWGRRTLAGHENKVEGRPFVRSAIKDANPRLLNHLEREINRLMEKHLG